MDERLKQVRSRAFALAFSGKFQTVERVESALSADYPDTWHLLQKDPAFRSYIGQIAHKSAKQELAETVGVTILA